MDPVVVVVVVFLVVAVVLVTLAFVVPFSRRPAACLPTSFAASKSVSDAALSRPVAGFPVCRRRYVFTLPFRMGSKMAVLMATPNSNSGGHENQHLHHVYLFFL